MFFDDKNIYKNLSYSKSFFIGFIKHSNGYFTQSSFNNCREIHLFRSFSDFVKCIRIYAQL
jgi:hypothetical protein